MPCSYKSYENFSAINNIYFNIKPAGRKNSADNEGRINPKTIAANSEISKNGKSHNTNILLTGAIKETVPKLYKSIGAVMICADIVTQVVLIIKTQGALWVEKLFFNFLNINIFSNILFIFG